MCGFPDEAQIQSSVILMIPLKSHSPPCNELGESLWVISHPFSIPTALRSTQTCSARGLSLTPMSSMTPPLPSP